MKRLGRPRLPVPQPTGRWWDEAEWNTIHLSDSGIRQCESNWKSGGRRWKKEPFLKASPSLVRKLVSDAVGVDVPYRLGGENTRPYQWGRKMLAITLYCYCGMRTPQIMGLLSRKNGKPLVGGDVSHLFCSHLEAYGKHAVYRKLFAEIIDGLSLFQPTQSDAALVKYKFKTDKDESAS